MDFYPIKFTLQNPLFHLYLCCCPEWPQASSCGGKIELKFCHLETDNEINSLDSKKSCQQSCSQGNQGDFPTADFGASWYWDLEWARGPVPGFSSACPLLCVVALSAAALEQRGWRPNLQPSGKALLGKEKEINITGFSSSLDVLTKDRSCWNGFILYLRGSEVGWAREVP